MPRSWSDTGGFKARFRRKTLALVNERYPDVGETERCRVAVFEHVLIQLENILSHSAFAERVANGSLKLFGWVVKEHSRSPFVASLGSDSGFGFQSRSIPKHPQVFPDQRGSEKHCHGQAKGTAPGTPALLDEISPKL